MKKFKIGTTFETTCIFTGGKHKHEIYARVADKLLCNGSYFELDGTHKTEEEFKIHEDENGEYIVVWEYHGHEGKVYAE